jgi:hypothetical protein
VPPAIASVAPLAIAIAASLCLHAVLFNCFPPVVVHARLAALRATLRNLSRPGAVPKDRNPFVPRHFADIRSAGTGRPRSAGCTPGHGR